MTPAPQTNPAQPTAAPSGINVDDVLFTLFRHKWLILSFFCMGVCAALFLRATRPAQYISESKLLIPFIVNRPMGPSADGIVAVPEPSALSTEMQIIWSHDVISNAVSLVGAERILAKHGGGHDSEAAAKVIAGGLEVEQPAKTSILMAYFRNTDQTIIQPVLSAVLESYKVKHVQYHIGADSEWSRNKCEELKQSLTNNEAQQKQLKMDNQVLILEDTKHSFEAQLEKARTELYDAQRELAERKAMLGEDAGSQAGLSNSVPSRVPSEVIEKYSNLVLDLADWKSKDRECEKAHMTPLHPSRIPIIGEIEKLNRQKGELLEKYPTLAQFSMSASTNSAGGGLAADLAEIKRFTVRVEKVGEHLTNIQAKAISLLDLEAKLHELERLHANDETNYNFLARSLQAQQSSQLMGAGNLINIVTAEHPTPPARDTKKLRKTLMTAFGGCFGCGLALAFLIDFVLDRSIKRTTDIERHLRLRVMQAIPDTAWNGRLQLPWAGLLSRRNGHGPPSGGTNGNGGSNGAVTLWNPVHQLYPYAEGLRERLMTYFEAQNQNVKKPKMVGLTSCGTGSGVTTLASGLAASLSKTGNGNVLLVDMNTEDRNARPFYQGKPGSGLNDENGEAHAEEQLFTASTPQEPSNKLVKAQTNGLNQLVPNLKASEYDYIIFDMPPVSQTSSTARFAGYMDIMLLVLEAEKTGQQSAMRAHAMMKESRANVAAVLNKCRRHVPALLSQEM